MVVTHVFQCAPVMAVMEEMGGILGSSVFGILVSLPDVIIPAKLHVQKQDAGVPLMPEQIHGRGFRQKRRPARQAKPALVLLGHVFLLMH